MNYLIAYFRASILFHYSIIVKANSGYINSDYSDERCRVYIWGFPCLDYSFDVQISQIGNVDLYNWFPYSYFTYCLISCSYVLIFTIHLSCTCVPDMHATWLYHMYSRVASDNPESHVQILEPGPWWPWCSWSECAADPSIVTEVQQKFGHRRSSSSQFLSCLAPKVPLAAREHLSTFVMYISPYCTFVFLVM